MELASRGEEAEAFLRAEGRRTASDWRTAGSDLFQKGLSGCLHANNFEGTRLQAERPTGYWSNLEERQNRGANKSRDTGEVKLTESGHWAW